MSGVSFTFVRTSTTIITLLPVYKSYYFFHRVESIPA
jgi:hypothetical protein